MDVTPIYEGFARTTARVGVRHSERYLAHLLPNNTCVLAGLAIHPEEHPATLRALARQVWQTGLVCVPVDGIAVREAEDEGVTDIAAVLVAGKEEIEVLDLVAVEFRRKEVTLGKQCHLFCDPLFDRNLLNFGDGLPPDEHISSEEDGMSMTWQDVVVATYVNGNFRLSILRLLRAHPQWKYCPGVASSYFLCHFKERRPAQ